jgi:hypothetical protein
MYRQGYLNFLQRLEQKAGSMKGVSIQRSHVLFGIGDLAKIKESEHKGIEHGEHIGGKSLGEPGMHLRQEHHHDGNASYFRSTSTYDSIPVNEKHLPVSG